MREFSGTWMRHAGDFWGGLAAMLVALPAAVAFGVTVYSAVSPQYAAFGAFAGILGAVALGLVAPTFGGTDRLITAPCAPAAAVLSAFAIEMVHQGAAPANIVLMMTVLGILTGAIQVLIGFLGFGRLIKYIPYPVVSGYLSGVGLIIIGGQIPKFAGVPVGYSWHQALAAPHEWDSRGLAIGGVTVAVMLISGRFVRKLPTTVVGLVAGLLTYAVIAMSDPALLSLEGNPLVVGSLGATGEGYLGLISDRWQEIGQMTLVQAGGLVGGGAAGLRCLPRHPGRLRQGRPGGRVAGSQVAPHPPAAQPKPHRAYQFAQDERHHGDVDPRRAAPHDATDQSRRRDREEYRHRLGDYAGLPAVQDDPLEVALQDRDRRRRQQDESAAVDQRGQGVGEVHETSEDGVRHPGDGQHGQEGGGEHP